MRFDVLGLSCNLISGPTVLPGEQWELDSIEFIGQGANNIFIIDDVYVNWKLKGEVECCCRFLFFFRRRQTKTVHKTYETNVKNYFPHNFPMHAYSSHGPPFSVPNPVNLLELIGELVGEVGGQVVDIEIFFLTPEQSHNLTNAINHTRPVNFEVGEWPEDPCN